MRASRLPRPGATASDLYLHQLREAEREAGSIAEAYIQTLRTQEQEAAEIARRAEGDAAFARLLRRINDSVATKMRPRQSPLNTSGRSSGAPKRGRLT